MLRDVVPAPVVPICFQVAPSTLISSTHQPTESTTKLKVEPPSKRKRSLNGIPLYGLRSTSWLCTRVSAGGGNGASVRTFSEDQVAPPSVEISTLPVSSGPLK